MSFADRDYARSGYGRGDTSAFARMRMWSVTTWLIVINVVVFLIDRILMAGGRPPILSAFGYFSADTAIYHLQIWRFITFQFLHANLGHIAFNMFALYFFGGLVERYFGSVRYLAFYLISGMAGPVSYMILMAGHYLVASPQTPLVGASAGIFGVLVGAAVIAPDATVLIWGIVPAKLRHIAIFMIFLAVYTILFFGHDVNQNAGGEAAHLGGAAVGYLLIRRPWLLDWARWKPRSPGGRGPRVMRQNDEAEQREVDRILAKIATQGLQSLTEAEKRTLARASKR